MYKYIHIFKMDHEFSKYRGYQKYLLRSYV